MTIEKAFGENRRLIEKANALIRAVRGQNYYQMAQFQKDIIAGLQEIIKNKSSYQVYFQEDFLESTLLSSLKAILEAQEQDDHILYADLVHLELVPFLQALQASIYDKEGILLEQDGILRTQKFLQRDSLGDSLKKIPLPSEEEYHVVPASTGALTVQIRNQEGEFYLHSNVDPAEEADLLVEQYFDCYCTRYIVYGLGMGYHIAALNKRCFQAARIDVYESDMNMIKLAYEYGLPEGMLTDNVHIYHDLYCKNIAHALNQGKFSFEDQNISDTSDKKDVTQFIIHFPSVRNIRNRVLEEIFDKFMAKESSMRNNKDRMMINFRDNIQHYSHYVDELQEKFVGKDVYLVAAGPSLDKNVEKLKKIDSKKSIILAVGTVFHKLINIGVRPDYVVFLDPGERTYGHIQGLETEQIPILVTSTAFRKIAENYAGPVYLVCQEGYQLAETFASDKGYQLYSTGGSVSTIALDVAIRLGAERVMCLGLDLAYPNHISHAEGTMDRQTCDMSNYYKVQSFDGGTVETSNLFLIYREWIEKRIEKETRCQFFNTSEGGAYIKGMKHCSLDDFIRNKG